MESDLWLLLPSCEYFSISYFYNNTSSSCHSSGETLSIGLHLKFGFFHFKLEFSNDFSFF
jgi:hypothetical protein